MVLRRFGYEGLGGATNGGAVGVGFHAQNVPMSRAGGSGSSYAHSPQQQRNIYYGH